MSSISIGHTLSGRYEVKSVIGQGGFGITYLAEHMLLKSKVCIKELYISGLNTRNLDETLRVDFHQKDSYRKSIRRFIEEAQKLQQFSHPNIVQVSDLFEDNNTAYMVMELIEGENLKQYVKRKGALEWLEAEKITKQLLDAVEQLHSKGLLHLDIKPENILIDQQGKITLIDFGSAKEFVSEKTHGSTAVMLTQGYAPIEQYHSRDKRKPTIDIYAIGATLYYLLTGEKPISAPERIDEQLKEPHTYNNVTISTQVSSAIMLAMQMKPGDRFQSVGEFREALYILEKSIPISSEKTQNKPILFYGLKVLLLLYTFQMTIYFFEINSKLNTPYPVEFIHSLIKYLLGLPKHIDILFFTGEIQICIFIILAIIIELILMAKLSKNILKGSVNLVLSIMIFSSWVKDPQHKYLSTTLLCLVYMLFNAFDLFLNNRKQKKLS